MKQWCSTRIMLYIKTIILNTVSHNHFLKLLSTKKNIPTSQLHSTLVLVCDIKSQNIHLSLWLLCEKVQGH